MTPPAQEVHEESQEAEANAELEANRPEDQGDGRDEQQQDQQQNYQQKHRHQSRQNQYNQRFSRVSGGVQTSNHNNRHKPKTTFKRIDVDPTKKYYTPEARESWGPNVKGKKFRKEKGKKKRSTGTGARIDGSVKSIRLS